MCSIYCLWWLGQSFFLMLALNKNQGSASSFPPQSGMSGVGWRNDYCKTVPALSVTL